MKLVKNSRRFAVGGVAASALGWAFACSSPAGPDAATGGSGGASGSVGATSGSSNSTGGAPSATGGTTSPGGAAGATGGLATAGSATTGGSPAGGTPSTAGDAGAGGQTASAGTSPGGAGTTGGGGGASATGGISAGGAAAGGENGGSAGSENGGSAGNAGGGAAGSSATGGSGGGSSDPLLEKFSFFVVSYPAIISLSGKAEGFGGDLRFGQADGLSGADEICRSAAELGFPGAGTKKWRAFLSATQGPGGTPVDARDRIGTGPWYDRLGRLFASDLDGLFADDRPAGDAAVINDFPNERGEPNHYVGPDGLAADTVDNHDTLTGSDTMGRLIATNAADTCNDWTSTAVQGSPRIGHSWPRSATSGRSWVSDHTVPGCVAGVDRTLGGTGSGSCVGCAGGYGGFYCFAVP